MLTETGTRYSLYTDRHLAVNHDTLLERDHFWSSDMLMKAQNKAQPLPNDIYPYVPSTLEA